MALTTEQRAELVALEALQDNVEPIEDFIARVAPEFTPIPWHLQQVFDLFELSRHQEVYATIAMPPRHGKTTAIALGLAWRTLYDPACLNFYATYGANLSRATSRRIRSLMRAVGVPLAEDAQNQTEWRTVLEGGLKATSMGADVTGYGCNGGIVVGDDLIKGRKQAESLLLRDTAWDWLRDDYMSRLEEGASMFVNSTRWHEDDVIGRLHEDPLGVTWRHVELPAVRDENGLAADERSDAGVHALWPQGGWDLDRLARIRMRGENGWWSLFQQRPTPRGGGMFKRSDFVIVDHRPRGGRWIRRWDLAASTGSSAAYTAGGLVGLVDGKLFVADVRRGRWEAHERDEMIKQTAIEDGVGVEVGLPQDPGQAGKSQMPHYAQMLHGFRIKFNRESGSKAGRADPYASQVGARNVHLVRAPWNREFLDEHEKFPNAAIKDQVDMMSGAYLELLGTPRSAPQGGKRGVV